MVDRACRLAVASAVFSFLVAGAGESRAANCTFESFWSGGCNKEMERGIVKIFEGPEKFFYFFKSNQYVRNDANGDKWNAERTIGDNWKGLWHRDIDAAVNWGNGKSYFFRGAEYMRYDSKTDKVDQGPRPIAGNWSGLWTSGIDAAVNWGNGKVYFFKGDEYMRYDIANDSVDRGFPKKIAGAWAGLWSNGIDAATNWGNGKVYFFKGSQYIRWDVKADKADPGFPREIQGNWKGLFHNGVQAALNWSSRYPQYPRCGDLNQRPCNVVEQNNFKINSCKYNYYEDFGSNTCKDLPKGYSPFTASLNSLGEAGEAAKRGCKQVVGDFIDRGNRPPNASEFSKAVKAPEQCIAHMSAGFACSMPSLVEIFQLDPADEFLKKLENEFNKRMNTPPCGHISNPDKIFEAASKGFCASFAMLVPPESLKTMACVSNLIMSPEFGKLFASASGGKLGSVRGTCTTAGEVSFGIAKLMLLDRYGRMLKGKAKTWMDDKNKAAFVDSGGGMAALESFERRNAGIKFLFLALKGVSIYTGLNDVFRIMNGIPECGVAAPPGQKVSNAVAGDGTLYTIAPNGHLLYFRHDATGRFNISGKPISTSDWRGFKFVGAARIPNQGGALYAVHQNGDLYYYRHDVDGKFTNWGTKIGTGWGGFKQFMVARFGVIYVVDQKGDLVIYRHDANLKFGPAKVIGNGWSSFKQLFSGGTNAFYGTRGDGKLYYFYHNEKDLFTIVNKPIGTSGWNFGLIGSGGNGTVYAVDKAGDLLYYRHGTNHAFVADSGKPIGLGWLNPGKFGLIVGQH